MNVRWLTSAVLLMLLSWACHKARKNDDSIHVKPTASPAEATTAAQNRVAEAFYDALLPKLTTCWGRLQGSGEVEFRFTYRREGNNWIWQKQEFAHSSLDKGQEAIATQCMQEAATGSSFPVLPEEAARDGKEFLIQWGWPVPLPKDPSAMARMISTGPGGGHECNKICQDCVENSDHRSYCATSCSGFTGCREDGTGTGCQMTRPACASGWSGMWGGGQFIALRPESLSGPGDASANGR